LKALSYQLSATRLTNRLLLCSIIQKMVLPMKSYTILLLLSALFFYTDTIYAKQTKTSIIKITLLEIKCTATNNSTTKTPPIYGAIKVFVKTLDMEVLPKYGKSILWEKKGQDGIALREGENLMINSGCSFELTADETDKSIILFLGDLYKNLIVKTKNPVATGDTKTGRLERYQKSDDTIRFDIKSLQQAGGKKYIRQRFGDSTVEVLVVYLVEVVG
jgi:hypothetical protein